MINIEDDEEGETGSSASHFVRIPLRGAHAQESAILALRIIAALDLYGRLLDSDGDIEDCDVLSLVGLDERKGRKRPLSTQVVKTAFKHQLEHLEQRFPVVITLGPHSIELLGGDAEEDLGTAAPLSVRRTSTLREEVER